MNGFHIPFDQFAPECRLKQFLVLSPPFVVASFASINECHEHIRWRARENSTRLRNYDVVNRFEEPGRVEWLASGTTGSWVWRAS